MTFFKIVFERSTKVLFFDISHKLPYRVSMAFLSFHAIAFVASMVLAAPTPLTSTSKAVAPYWGLYRSPHGFEIDARNTKWKVSEDQQPSENVLVLFQSDTSYENVFGMLTARVDESPRAKNPKSYVEGWMALYDRLGFEVLGHRPFEHHGEKAYVVDLIQKKESRQARQVLFFRGTRAIVLTCNDHKERFKDSLPVCNKLIQTFKWLNPTPIQKM